jgi:Fe-S cluster assembly protein SufD
MRAPHVPEIPEALKAAAGTVMGQAADPTLTAFRSAAWNAFAAQGIPGTKHEDFSFVSSADLKSALTKTSGNVGGVTLPTQLPSGTEAFTLGNAPESLVTEWTKAATTETDIPATLAAALAPEPLVVRIGSSPITSSPLSLRFSATSGRKDYAVFVRVEPGVEASLSLETDAASDAFVNASVFVSLGENARLDVFQRDASAGIQMHKLRFAVARDARLNLLSVSTGSRLARLAIEADLLAPGAAIDLRGAAAVSASNRVHRHLKIRHAAPDCVSKQLFKAVVTGAGRSSVDGTVVVDRGAQRTDARQLLQHLLLSPDGRADAKPRLLIHADDVKCSHGATVGKTDPAQLFYLLSRGLDATTAKALLTQAYLGEALEIAPEDQRAAAWTLLTSVLTPPPNPLPSPRRGEERGGGGSQSRSILGEG